MESLQGLLFDIDIGTGVRIFGCDALVMHIRIAHSFQTLRDAPDDLFLFKIVNISHG